MAPRRSSKQQVHLEKMREQRRQEGGPGPSSWHDEECGEIQKAKAAQMLAEEVLEKAEAQLQVEHTRGDNFHKALRAERQKVARAEAAKERAEISAADAQNSMEVLKDRLGQ